MGGAAMVIGRFRRQSGSQRANDLIPSLTPRGEAQDGICAMGSARAFGSLLLNQILL